MLTNRDSLSRRIIILLMIVMAILFITFCSFIYFALVKKIDAEDAELISSKIEFILPHLKSGDPSEIRGILAERYPQDLRKRVYVVIYDHQGESFGRTFNTHSEELADIFPVHAQSHWTILDKYARPEKIPSKDNRVFNVATIKTTDAAKRDWILRVAVDHDTEERILSTVGAAFFALFVLVVVAVPASSGLVTHLIMRPLKSLTFELEKMTLGQANLSLDFQIYPREFQGLITTFNRMSQDALQSFNRLESFSSDIAHELRNPLNSLRGQLEVLSEKPRSIDEYQETFSSTLEDVHRLCSLVDRLLFLLRGERKLLKTEILHIKLSPLFEKIKEIFEPLLLENKGLFTVNCEKNLFIYAEPHLLQRALINLVENALKYGVPKNPTTPQIVSLSAAYIGKSNEQVEITVDDNGPGIAPRELPYIFDRLYRSDQARENRGFGLGLAIVRMIMDLHDAHVDVSNLPQGGCRFRLVLSGMH